MDKPQKAYHQPTPTRLGEDDIDEWNDTDRRLEEALYAWRDNTALAEWGPYHPVGGLGIIDDEQIERIIRLARRQLIPNMETFERELRWLYMPERDTEVLAIVHNSHQRPIPEPTPISKPTIHQEEA